MLRNFNVQKYIFSFLIVSTALFIKEGQAQSLEDVLSQTYRNSPQILAARATLDQTLEEIPQAWSKFLPNISYSNSYTRENARDIYTGDTSGSDTRTNTLSLSQNLVNFSNITGFDKAKHNIETQRQRLRVSEQKVLLEAVSTYLNVMKNTKIVALKSNNVSVLEAHLKSTEIQFELRRRTNGDLAQAQSRLAKSEADLASAQVSLDKAKSKFFRVNGLVPKNLEMPFFNMVLPENVLEVEERAISRPPSVLAASSAVAAAKEEISIKKRDFAPQLALSGSVANSHTNNRITTGTETLTSSIGLTLTVPIFQSGGEYNSLRVAKAALRQSFHQLDTARRTALDNAQQAWEDIVGGAVKIKAFQAQVNAAEIALKGITAELEVGRRTLLNLLDSEQELLDAKVNFESANFDHMIAQYTVMERIGQLEASNLGLN